MKSNPEAEDSSATRKREDPVSNNDENTSGTRRNPTAMPWSPLLALCSRVMNRLLKQINAANANASTHCPVLNRLDKLTDAVNCKIATSILTLAFSPGLVTLLNYNLIGWFPLYIMRNKVNDAIALNGFATDVLKAASTPNLVNRDEGEEDADKLEDLTAQSEKSLDDVDTAHSRAPTNGSQMLLSQTPFFRPKTFSIQPPNFEKDSTTDEKKMPPNSVLCRSTDSFNNELIVGSMDSVDSVNSNENMSRGLHRKPSVKEKPKQTIMVEGKSAVYESCHGSKSLGYIYMTPKEVNQFKAAVVNLLYCVLDIQAQEGESSVKEPGFFWITQKDRPIMEQLNGKESIKLATVPTIIYSLVVAGSSTDHDFLIDFLRTYRYFSNGVDIARVLIMIFVTSKTIAKKDIESGGFAQTKMSVDDRSTQIQLRIVNLFRKWISDQSTDFRADPLLTGILRTFLTAQIMFDAKLAPYGQRMMEQLTEFSSSSNLAHATSEKDLHAHLKTLRSKSNDSISIKPARSNDSLNGRVLNSPSISTPNNPFTADYDGKQQSSTVRIKGTEKLEVSSTASSTVRAKPEAVARVEQAGLFRSVLSKSVSLESLSRASVGRNSQAKKESEPTKIDTKKLSSRSQEMLQSPERNESKAEMKSISDLLSESQLASESINSDGMCFK